MFTHDMAENRSSSVSIIDLEDDTVYDMISYIYSGRVSWSDQLYYARVADPSVLVAFSVFLKGWIRFEYSYFKYL